ncbi:hypothetical protein BD413DRAFT_568941 [Trametes elegans]|nr:hypothetical protein BD413DRAFT_568941 [Trametes elegans]
MMHTPRLRAQARAPSTPRRSHKSPNTYIRRCTLMPALRRVARSLQLRPYPTRPQFDSEACARARGASSAKTSRVCARTHKPALSESPGPSRTSPVTTFDSYKYIPP